MVKVPMGLDHELGKHAQGWLEDCLYEVEVGAPSIPKSFLDWYYDPFEEKPGFRFENLDEAQAAIADAVASERGSQWRIGDLMVVARDTFGPYGTYKQLASVCAYTTRRLKQFEVLARTFEPELRFPDQPLLLYETALKFDDPVAALEKALEEEWSPRELQDVILAEKGEKVSRVKLYSGEAPLVAHGELWRIAVEAGRDWPEGDGEYTVHVTVKQIIAE